MPRRYTAEKSGLWCGKAGDSVRGTTDRGGAFMYIRTTKFSQAAAGIAIAGALTLAPARAQETVKIGLILPMTGGQASTRKQIDNAVKRFIQQNAGTPPRQPIQLTLNDHPPPPH